MEYDRAIGIVVNFEFMTFVDASFIAKNAGLERNFSLVALVREVIS